MRGEAFVVTAADLANGQSQQVGHELIELIAAMALGQRSVLCRLEFPGEPSGGFIFTPRRQSWVSRLLWRLGTRPMRVAL